MEIDDDMANKYASALINKILDGLADILLLTDFSDIGKFDRLHHWHIGAAIKLLVRASEIFGLGKSLIKFLFEATKKVVGTETNK